MVNDNTDIQEQITRIYRNAQNRILLYAQASLPQSQYHAFRKLVLDEMGMSGAEGKLKQILKGKGRHDK